MWCKGGLGEGAFPLLLALLFLSGCAGGYTSYKADVGGTPKPLPSLKDVKIGYYTSDPLVRLSLERVQIERFQAQNLLLPATDSPESDRFIIIVRRQSRPSKLSVSEEAWGVASLASMAAVPVVMRDGEDTLELTLRSGQQEIQHGSYNVTKRLVSWLPLGLFWPNFVFFLNGPAPGPLDEQEKIPEYERVLTRFIADAAPALLHHQSR